MTEDPDGNFAKFVAFTDKYKDDLKKLLGKLKGNERLEIIRRIFRLQNYDDVDAYELGLLEPKNSSEMEKKPEKRSGKRKHCDAGQADDHEAKARPKMTKKKKEEEIDLAPSPEPQLPEKLRQRMERMNGSNPVLVIQKELYKTDVSPQHGRLSMPESQIQKELFLTEEELQLLDSRYGSDLQDIKAMVIGPSSRFEGGVSLKKWSMGKKSGSVTSTYNLVSGWNKVVSKNKLRQGMAVQVWAFRKESKLCFALAKAGGEEDEDEDEDEDEGEGEGSSHGGTGSGDDGSDVVEVVVVCLRI
ncbi:B3 domain-containing protein At2g31420-like [Diospyros lotus]|uniref:B3 domain-containing protein At2g31420-like n=1 Tax=Diospyros lotus TaxID=55363 RepID=UPI002256B8BA|nr:B3 domain-containing protein At2g31420-like [Diospyros lotus]